MHFPVYYWHWHLIIRSKEVCISKDNLKIIFIWLRDAIALHSQQQSTNFVNNTGLSWLALISIPFVSAMGKNCPFLKP